MAAAPKTSPRQRFQTIGRRWIDDAYVSRPTQVPEIVYHYTDAAGLAGMLLNHSIWATDHRFLNDRSEIGHTHGLVRDLLEAKLGHSDPLLRRFYKHIVDLRKSPVICDRFIFSLSEERDDLSQWRGYAREGQGFTVGFCGPSLSEVSGPDLQYSFVQVEYSHERQEAALRRLLSALEKAIRKATEEFAEDKAIEEAAKCFDWVVENWAAVNKHQSFRLEREWRIVEFVPEADRAAEVRVRVSERRLVSYVELQPQSSDTGKLPLKTIGIGPGFTGAEQYAAVKSLCDTAGYDVPIYEADTPYRRVSS